MCTPNSWVWRGNGEEGGCKVSIKILFSVFFNYQTYSSFVGTSCRSYIGETLTRKAMSAGGRGCWWGHRGGEVLRQELCAQELKGQVAAHNLRADRVNYSGGGRTDKKCSFHILNYRIAGDWDRSDYLQRWIKKLKAALMRIHLCIYQSLVLLITGVRKMYLQFISPSVVWLLWPSATTCFLSKLFSLYSIPKKGHSELWLRREEQPVVTPLSQPLPEPCSCWHRHSGCVSTWECFVPLGSNNRSKPRSQITRWVVSS